MYDAHRRLIARMNSLLFSGVEQRTAEKTAVYAPDAMPTSVRANPPNEEAP